MRSSDLTTDVFAATPNGWFHLVVNFIAPNTIRLYHNRTMVGHKNFFSHHHNVGDGRIIIGRQYTDTDGLYTSIQIDELRFFNRTLTEAQILMLSQLPN